MKIVTLKYYNNNNNNTVLNNCTDLFWSPSNYDGRMPLEAIKLKRFYSVVAPLSGDFALIKKEERKILNKSKRLLSIKSLVDVINSSKNSI